MVSFIDRIVTDQWRGVYCNEQEMHSPSISDIDRAIKALDAETHTIASLYGQNGAYLNVGGGNGKYIVYVSTKEGELWNLLSGSEDVGVILLNVGGQEGDFPARQVVGKDFASRAAETFFGSGKMDADLMWEKQS